MTAAIQVNNLSKRYTLGAQKQPQYRTLRDLIAESAGSVASKIRHPLTKSASAKSTSDFWALKDVGFTIQAGDRVGIIGRNGAGKSTLLKLLSRITEPTSGTISLNGRVASLLEVGTGFHPELTGRENIFLNGAILGMSRAETRKKFDEIVAFSEVDQFLDTPVKRYSSGMYVRLAFAVAAHLEPDILIVDEVLAVGDAQFQNKCFGKLGEIGSEGRTVLFVSHNITALRHLCKQGIYLHQGSVAKVGGVEECIDDYLAVVKTRRSRAIDHGIEKSKAISIHSLSINGSEADVSTISSTQRSLDIEILGDVHFASRVNVEVRLLCTADETVAICSPGYMNGETPKLEPGPLRMRCRVELPKLTRGEYYLGVTAYDPGVQSFIEFPLAVRLQVEGWPMESGLAFEKSSGVGSIALDGQTTYW